MIPVGVALAALAPPPAVADSLAGLGLGGGMLWGLAAVYRWRTGRIGLGMGDVKLVAMLGAYLGVLGVLGVLVVGSFIGLLQGAWLLSRGRGDRKTAIPFGPALAAAGLLHLYNPVWLFELSPGAL
jgi:leader peptidase (prepilin peptidase)/N-methyltransferase